MTDRLVALESKIAVLEHLVDVLGGELAAHQRTIDRLQQDLADVLQFLKRSPTGESIEPHDTRPPHWGGGA
jgi:uncharacterized coiled-coil protein SlyX